MKLMKLMKLKDIVEILEASVEGTRLTRLLISAGDAEDKVQDGARVPEGAVPGAVGQSRARGAAHLGEQEPGRAGGASGPGRDRVQVGLALASGARSQEGRPRQALKM
jgi:hypothetical protein